MAEKNVQIRHHNGVDWDDLFPKTKAGLVGLASGKTVEVVIGEVLAAIDTKATPAQVAAEITKIIDGSPAALDTLNELAAALGDDPNFAATVSTQIGLKADKSTTYTKTEVDTKVNAKANQSTTYTKTEVDTKVNAKANTIDVYTKTEVDSKDALKANASDVYTKTQVDTVTATKVDKVAGKALSTNDFTTVLKSKLEGLKDHTSEITTLTNNKADKTTTYTKTEVDTRLADVKATAVPVSTTAPTGSTLWFQELA